MGVKRLDDLAAYQLAVEFKRQVYALVRGSLEASRDLRCRPQLFEAAASVEANVAEGWARYTAGEIAQFIRVGLGSLEESKRRVRDGADRGYFTEDQCQPVLVTGNRCGAALMALWRSLQPFIDRPPRKTRQCSGGTPEPEPSGPFGPDPEDPWTGPSEPLDLWTLGPVRVGPQRT